MTLRICAIGNSHLAAVRQGWDLLEPVRPGMSVEFFGSHAETLEGLDFQDGRSVIGDPVISETFAKLGMRGSFHVEEFDAFVLVALQVSMFRAMSNGLTVQSFPSYGTSRAKTRTLVSEPLYHQLVTDRLQNTLAFRMAKRLRRWTNAPIHVIPQPNPSSEILNLPEKHRHYRDAIRSGDAEPIAEIFRQACDRAFDGLADVHRQPEQTVTLGACTNLAHTQGSVRLAHTADAHPAADVLHANAAFGKLAFGRVLDQMSPAYVVPVRVAS